MLKPPCSILTGFLGSGKTTLLQYVLEQGLSQGPVAIVMNELGEIGIDGNVITDFQSVEKMVELNSGCVCCSISELQLGQALNEIVDEVAPRLIIIETTGVAEPRPIEARLRAFGFNIESVVSVVDALTYPGVAGTEDIIKSQIEPADFIVLNKIDGIDTVQRHNIESALLKLNSRAHLIPTNYGAVDPQLLFTAGAKRKSRSHAAEHPGDEHSHRHGAGHVDTFSFSSPHHLDMTGFFDLLKKLPKEIIRAKGILVRGENAAPTLFNYVCGRFDFRDMPEFKNLTSSQAVFIGTISDTLRQELQHKLQNLTQAN